MNGFATTKYVRLVSKTNRQNKYDTSNYGDNMFLSAPFEVSAYYLDGYTIFAGTSAATPHVSGSAALLWNQFPWASNSQIEDALAWGATDLEEPCWDEKNRIWSVKR